ncbi:hypothetical protein [Motilimonas sp. E26]|uniref:hypothetical protein n=1 Tax=Motilimonas TaxID=1914248 RepID=UPI001E3C788F|nr:hypothetical protein [Motilimonas sp. E26]MCE0557002.1 hypothetical protein [Motilimonas sp. E26]
MAINLNASKSYDTRASTALTKQEEPLPKADLPTRELAGGLVAQGDKITLSDEAKERYANQQQEHLEQQKQQALEQAKNLLLNRGKESESTSGLSREEQFREAQIKQIKEQIKEAKSELQKLAYKHTEAADKKRSMLHMSVVMMTGQLLELMRKKIEDAPSE